MRFRVAYLLPPALLPLAVLAASAVGEFGCASAPAQEALRTFDRAERLATVCVRVATVKDGVRTLIEPVAVPDSECPKVPGAIDPSAALAHVVGFVTQTTRGELAAVDLSSSSILDVDRTTPGVDPIVAPVLPTDVAASSDSSTIFVAGGSPGAYALYGAPTVGLLGQGFFVGATPPPSLLAYRACALPSRPSRVFALPNDATNPFASPGRIAVVLGGTRLDPARVLILDAAPFTATGSLVPGAVEACPILGSIEVAGAPNAVPAGQSWGDGLGFDGGTAAIPLPGAPAGCKTAGDAGADGGSGDAGTGDAGTGDAGAVPEASDAPRIGDGARDDHYLYLADSARPVVHVIDVADPAKPKELAPYVLTSAVDATRVGGTLSVAVSPPTRNFKRFLYAIDSVDGSIAVFDATDPTTASRAPLQRPHPEANPFQAPDRLVFGAKAAQVAFARHDFPLLRDAKGNVLPSPKTGLLCNPNPGATDDGVAYTANGNYTATALGPNRLRGIFGFVTLTNGEVTVIDVDDWDAPCRRPADLGGTVPVSDATPPMPVGPSSDPYGAPIAASGATTDEAYYPVSAPHRPRTSYFLREDADQGRKIPALASPPTLSLVDAPLPTQGPEAAKYPTILPTTTAVRDFTLADPTAVADASVTTPSATSVPGVRLSWEAPELQVDQTWTVTYEGALPGFGGLSGRLSSTDGEKSLILAQQDALFCRRGVEDAYAGRERATRLTPALATSGGAPSRNPSKTLADYVQITNDVVPASDPWWTDGVLPSSCEAVLPGSANQRQALCQATFGNVSDELLERDLPILEAYDDRLVLGRFGYTDRAKGISAREVVPADGSNADLLRRARCCFQDRVSFQVRAGASFVAVGSASGYLHHVSRDPSGACVLSCSDRERLLESRVFPSPRPTSPTGFVAVDRNSPLAFRNPFFSFVAYEAASGAVGAGQSTAPGRDMTFRFQTRGGYSSLIYNLAAQSSAVSPRSLQYIESLGELAVVDGSAQGLVLIDLSTLTLGRPSVN